MKEAMFWKSLGKNDLQCRLCNHFCKIKDGQMGICGVRVNRGGKLYSEAYGKLVAEGADPIEKKPFFHFLPGSLSYSVASAGCNFSCPFCQNYRISQFPGEEADFPVRETTPSSVVDAALSAGCLSLSYTYTEPTVFFEFALDTSRIASEKGLRNNFVTNGYAAGEAIRLIAPFLDAANVDLKGDEEFYRNLCGARQKPVIDNIRLMKELGIWVEITTLLIPEYNDSTPQLRKIAGLIKDIDPAIPWHVSRFFPVYKMSGHYPASVGKVSEARQIGLDAGLKYVYTGNIPGDAGENTYCYSCNALLIERSGYRISENNMKEGRCGKCGAPIDGVFS